MLGCVRDPALVILPAFLAGCSAPAGLTADWAAVSVEAAEATVELSPTARAAAERLLVAPSDPAGERAAPDEASWRIGDRLVFGVSVADEDGEERHWLLELAVRDLPRLDPKTGGGLEFRLFNGEVTTEGETRTVTLGSVLIELEVRVYDGTGELLGAEARMVPEAFLREGLRPTCTSAHAAYERLAAAATAGDAEGEGHADDPDDADDTSAQIRAVMDTLVRGLAVTTTLANTLLQTEELRPILRAVVRRPPLALLLGGPPKLMVSPEFDAATDAPPVQIGSGPPVAASHLPLALEAGGHPALAARLTVVEPSPLLRLAAGLVAIEARRPGTDHPRLSVRLVGARRGAGRALSDSVLPDVPTVPR